MEYKIIEKTEDKKNCTIEKTGHKIRFTLNEFDNVEERNKKTKKEVEKQLEVERAKMANIEHHHDFVLDMKDEDMFAVFMYYQAKQMVKIGEEKLSEFVKHEEENAKELEEIKRQLPELFTEDVVNENNTSEN